MTFDALYDKILKEFPQLANYIVVDKSGNKAMRIYCTDQEEYQILSNAFLAIVWYQDLPEAFSVRVGNLSTGKSEWLQMTSKEILQQIRDSISSVEPAIQQFSQIVTEHAEGKKALLELGFETTERSNDGPMYTKDFNASLRMQIRAPKCLSDPKWIAKVFIPHPAQEFRFNDRDLDALLEKVME